MVSQSLHAIARAGFEAVLGLVLEKGLFPTPTGK